MVGEMKQLNQFITFLLVKLIQIQEGGGGGGNIVGDGSTGRFEDVIPGNEIN